MSKNKISIIIGLFAGLLLLGFWITAIDFEYLKNSFNRINPLFVIASGLSYILAYFVRSCRWNLLLRNQIRLTNKESWLVSSAGNWINYLIPIRAGEFIKAILIKKIRKASAVSVLPSVFIDKFFDTVGIFLVLLLIPMMHVRLATPLKVLLVLLILVFVILFGILILAATHKKSITGILQKVFSWLPIKIRNRINGLIELFINGLNIFEHRRDIIIYALVLTSVGILLDGLYFYLLFRAFDHHPFFMIVLFGYTLINLSYILPQPPAQLGSNEWMMLIIFSLGFGFDKNAASSIMVFAHIFATFMITVLGIMGFSYAGVHSLKQINREL